MATITYIRQGDLLSSKMHTLVNTVNCVGVMGKGLALQFKERYPDILQPYKNYCKAGLMHPGGITGIKDVKSGRLIVCAATKDHWRDPSRIEWIQQILQLIVYRRYQDWDMQSIAISKLGCGNGGLSWSVVGPMMAHYLAKLPVGMQVEIYIEESDKTYWDTPE